MRKSRLSRYKQSRLIEHFVSGSTARTVALLVGVNKSVYSYPLMLTPLDAVTDVVDFHSISSESGECRCF